MLVYIDSESLPSLNLLQGGLLNDDGYSREFSLLTVRLLKCAIDDPGFGNPRDVSGFIYELCNTVAQVNKYIWEVLLVFLRPHV